MATILGALEGAAQQLAAAAQATAADGTSAGAQQLDAKKAADSFLRDLEGPLSELSHPLGSLAFHQASATSRTVKPERELLKYADGTEEVETDDNMLSHQGGFEPDTAPTSASEVKAEPCSDDIAKAAVGLCKDVGGTASVNGEAPEAMEVTMDTSNPKAQAPEAGSRVRKRSEHKKGGVDLPLWLDLDQETLPNAVKVRFAAEASAECDDSDNADDQCSVSVTAASGKRRVVQRPSKLGEFGGVGELTVQMHTASVPPAAQDDSFEAMLSAVVEARARRDAIAAGKAENPSQMGQRKTPDSSYVCYNCNQPGHWREQCPAPPKRSFAQGELGEGGAARDGRRAKRKTPDAYVCHNCNQPGHWREECPLAQKAPKGTPSASGASGAASQQHDGDAPKKKGAKREHGPPETYVCNMCHQPGHWIQQCPLKPAERAVERGPPPPSYVCKKCSVPGHWIELCSVRSIRPVAGAPAVPELEISEEIEEIADEIAEALGEVEPEATGTIRRVVAALGEEGARHLLTQTWLVEEQGGLLRLDGSGVRRTSGGVFLWLVKQKASNVQRMQIWRQVGAAGGGRGAPSSAAASGAQQCMEVSEDAVEAVGATRAQTAAKKKKAAKKKQPKQKQPEAEAPLLDAARESHDPSSEVVLDVTLSEFA